MLHRSCAKCGAANHGRSPHLVAFQANGFQQMSPLVRGRIGVPAVVRPPVAVLSRWPSTGFFGEWERARARERRLKAQCHKLFPPAGILHKSSRAGPLACAGRPRPAFRSLFRAFWYRRRPTRGRLGTRGSAPQLVQFSQASEKVCGIRLKAGGGQDCPPYKKCRGRATCPAR